MADDPSTEPVSQPTYLKSIIDAMVSTLDKATSPEILAAQRILLQRLALSGDVVPSRVPAPRNITEVGGYLNLLQDQPELRAQMLASVLGVAGPTPPLGWDTVDPTLFFVTRPNDRTAPTPEQAAAIPVELTVRSDFLAPIEQLLDTVHNLGCTLPLLTPARSLPPAGGLASSTGGDLLRWIGRSLQLAPTAALVDPDADPLALASTGAGPLQLVARQLDASAPHASEVAAASWTAWTCTASGCTSDTKSRKYLPLGPLLQAAGWYQPTPTAPSSLGDAGPWTRWTNVTGLVAGETTYGSELSLLYRTEEIAASMLRDRVAWVWDGTSFVAALQ